MIFDWLGNLLILIAKFFIWVVITVLNVVTFPLSVYSDIFPPKTVLGNILFFGFSFIYIAIVVPKVLGFLMETWLSIQIYLLKLFKKKK